MIPSNSQRFSSSFRGDSEASSELLTLQRSSAQARAELIYSNAWPTTDRLSPSALEALGVYRPISEMSREVQSYWAELYQRYGPAGGEKQKMLRTMCSVEEVLRTLITTPSVAAYDAVMTLYSIARGVGATGGIARPIYVDDNRSFVPSPDRNSSATSRASDPLLSDGGPRPIPSATTLVPSPVFESASRRQFTDRRVWWKYRCDARLVNDVDVSDKKMPPMLSDEEQRRGSYRAYLHKLLWFVQYAECTPNSYGHKVRHQEGRQINRCQRSIV